jgi:hypothetical protein
LDDFSSELNLHFSFGYFSWPPSPAELPHAALASMKARMAMLSMLDAWVCGGFEQDQPTENCGLMWVKQS